MFKKILLIVCCFIGTFSVNAQTDSSGLQISLLTCGTGDEIWAQFGHTAVRVVDSNNGTDLVYNYGTFSFGEGFEVQFMRGKLLYYVSYYPYEIFLEEYKYEQRSVVEQVLHLKADEKRAIQYYLVNNAKEENKYYKYDFFFDNCATRIRDIFPKVLGSSFQFGQTLPTDHNVTYRDVMNQYFYIKHFERVGCNILLGSKIDKPMSNTDVMWVPDFLMKGIETGTVNGEPIADKAQTIVPEGVKRTEST
ncbi:MAG: DUF4105 domain-containing protein, partial [Chitinophagaceae bacterium]|nr:DUF4105 domain-containing protein [Chitinophagaceae bacterium]